MKRAFTLIELLVSMSLLLMMTIFLYQSYDVTLSTNKSFEEKVDKRVLFNETRKIILEDFLEGKVLAIQSNGNNSVLLLKSNNSYHNPFFQYITYFISKENNLIRIESYEPFDVQKLNKSFFNKAFIDIIQANMKQFRIDGLKENNRAYSIILEKNSGEVDIFTSLQLLES